MTRDEMTKLAELKRLAEAAKKYTLHDFGGPYSEAIDYLAAASPDTLLRLIAEIERLRADAERYRWLRSFRQHHPLFVIFADAAPGDMMLYDDGLDAAIDAARAELEKKL